MFFGFAKEGLFGTGKAVIIKVSPWLIGVLGMLALATSRGGRELAGILVNGTKSADKLLENKG